MGKRYYDVGVAIFRFLKAARNRAKEGMSKEQILDFARREFGEVSKLLKKQIDDIFKAKPKTEKKGDVVPIKKDEGIMSQYKSMDDDLTQAEKDAIFDNFLADADRTYANFVTRALRDIQKAPKSEQQKMIKAIKDRTGMFRYLDDADAEKILKSVGVTKGGIVRRPEEFATRKEYKKYLDETLGPSDDVFGSPMKDDLLKEWDKVKAKDVTPKEKFIPIRKDQIDDIESAIKADEGIVATDEAADMVKGEINLTTDQMSTQQRKFLGFPNRKVEAIVRTAARDVLEKAGLGPRIKGQDPIDMARQIYGDDILDALDNISGELLEASSYPEISRILTEKKIYNFKPRQGLDVRQKGEIEDITAFDPKDRKPNADGGLINILKL